MFISIHAPAKGATRTSIISSTDPDDFNPRSREGSDEGTESLYTHIDISIHAPAKGATTAYTRIIHLPAISIHAPAKGATWLRCRHSP